MTKSAGAEMPFDDFPRTHVEPKTQSCPTFAFWNACAWPEHHQLRLEIERWYQRYPQCHRKGLRQRFRSKDDTQHRSAFFELFLHEVLKREFGEVEVEPQTARGTRPDFLVLSESEKLYVEAVSTSGLSASEKSSETRKAQFVDAVGRIDTDRFALSVTILIDSDKILPRKFIRDFLSNWLAQLDPEEQLLARAARTDRAIPSCVWEYDGWRVKFEAYARPERGPCRVARVNPIRELRHRERLFHLLKAKAKRYGKLDAPLLVVVDVESITANDIAFQEALLGQVEMVVDLDNDSSCPRRVPNGLWSSASNRRVSGVIFVQSLKWWTVKTAPATLYPNPWAFHPYRGTLQRLRRLELNGDRPRLIMGDSIGSGIPVSECMAVAGLPSRRIAT